MIYKCCNGTVMLSSESDVVKNNIVYSELEKCLISLSAKYGLGEVLFREKILRTIIPMILFILGLLRNGLLKKCLRYGIAF